MKFSVVIRNRNKHNLIDRLLSVLVNNYANDINDIIVVDNNSNLVCFDIYKKYEGKIRIINIDSFTYGKAINLGVEQCKNKWILLMSSQCIPIGNYFFYEIRKNIFDLGSTDNIAGLRLNMQQKSFDYLRYLNFNNNRNFLNVEQAFDRGILASGAIVNKMVWNLFKFDEEVLACEDKIWSYVVIKNKFHIIPSSACYFYDVTSKNYKTRLRTYYIENLERLRFLKHEKINFAPLKSLFYSNFLKFFKDQYISLVTFFINLYIFIKISKK